MTADVVDRVIEAVAESAPRIRAGLVDHRDRALDEENPTGDTVIRADVLADRILEERIAAIDGVGTYASEDREDPIDVGAGLAVTVDPLDGSSNVPSNNLVGTILGVYDDALPAPGRSLVAAAYVVYGPVTTMVVAVDGTVTELALAEEGMTTLRRDVALPDEPTVFGFGGRVPDWPPAFEGFAREVERELKLRYGGSMVGDVNQVMAHGGMFAYPALRDRPAGKLRLQFESAPMAYVVEAAGGRSSTGSGSILGVEPTDLHQRVPTHLGDADLIDRLEAALAD